MFQKTDTVRLFWKTVWQGEQVVSVASASGVYSQLWLSCLVGLSCALFVKQMNDTYRTFGLKIMGEG